MQTRTQMLMGTFVDITLPQKNHQAITHAFKIIQKIESHLSSYNPLADIYQLNQKKLISSNPILKKVLTKSINYYYQTDGYFDITIGSITKKLYHFGETPHSPTLNALKNASLNINAISLEKNITIKKNIIIDLGGIGKGFAVDKVADYLKDKNITKGIIALSGDIRCLNTCKIGIQSPFEEKIFASIITKIPNIAISTSGTYRRYATKKEEHHLINPKKRIPQKNFLSVSLFSLKNNTRLDAFTTAISVMPPEKVFKFLKKYPSLSYLLIFKDGSVYYKIDKKRYSLIIEKTQP